MDNSTYGKKADMDLRLWSSLSSCYQAVKRKVETLLHEKGLSLPQFNVLQLLSGQSPLSISTVMEKIQSTPGNMTVVIENLARDGMIEKARDDRDKRVNLVSITQKGRSVLKELYPPHIINIQNLFNCLDPREKSALNDLSLKLWDNIKD